MLARLVWRICWHLSDEGWLRKRRDKMKRDKALKLLRNRDAER
jgi:hypothetical protein